MAGATYPHILLVVPRLNIGGAESYVATTAVALARRGYQVTVASWGGQLAARLKDEGIRHYLVPIRLNSYLASWWLYYIIKKHNISLVHANSAAAGAAALKACRRLNIPLVYTAHGVFGYNRQEMELVHVDKIICVSNFVRQRSLAIGIPPERLVTIYNGIDLTKFVPQPERTLLVRREYGLQATDFVLGIVSRIKNLKAKGHEDMLQLLAKYSGRQTPNWRLLVVGKGKGEVELKREAKRRGLGDKICFAGHQTDVPQIMQAMDVVVLPSDFETFGLVLAEAMAMGKPVITYAVGGTPEAIEDGVTGYLVPKGDIDVLYERINRLYTDPQLRNRMGQNGITRVRKMFDSEKMMEQIIAVYDELLPVKPTSNV
ncbi:glycosyltransferase family 4 protein [Sporomusa acidovorans]|uniref:N-acetyl-alpha-D-glucosaminyl L-malate synthase n=1 Tax=Sporomusa acidovorans (strain ATCC 49682 / DSM 3132 / Mol) TaxID=1123286 RepID=A0ABZ3J6Z4_SPOA4|nr:glycosyltransferase family 4 protein [Sporomusa acidovorans]OZC19326.1 putative glycosyltransferase EpsD [Sporomusa acidovorans DSM 3132]SDD80667.1 Glycosyltransferase involved in cell wall bisynthesis [Sporomusa acidovorans]